MCTPSMRLQNKVWLMAGYESTEHFSIFLFILSQQQWIEMVGEATLITILRLHVEVHLCKDLKRAAE